MRSKSQASNQTGPPATRPGHAAVVFGRLRLRRLIWLQRRRKEASPRSMEPRVGGRSRDLEKATCAIGHVFVGTTGFDDALSEHKVH